MALLGGGRGRVCSRLAVGRQGLFFPCPELEAETDPARAAPAALMRDRFTFPCAAPTPAAATGELLGPGL